MNALRNFYVYCSIYALAFVTILASCGQAQKSSDMAAAGHPRATTHDAAASSLKQAEAATAGTIDVPIVPITCLMPKSDLSWLTNLTQDLFSRAPLPAEMARAKKGELDREAFVDEALESFAAAAGISRFVANLFRVDNIQPNLDDDDRVAEEAALAADLQKEPIELVLRNMDKPWPWFFTTRDFYCTKRTARLYENPVLDAPGFVPCTLPQERAGFLGLVSVLRAFPSSFFSSNNNYHRVAFAVYLTQGIQLLSATNGPQGNGSIPGLAQCVPATDMRVSDSGLVYGTASVPLEGPICAGCHARYNGPLSIAFRRFGADGRLIEMPDLERLDVTERLGVSVDYLKTVLAEQKSCYSTDGISPPRPFKGIPGLGRVLAESANLGRALGIQIPQLLANVQPDANMITSVEKSYEDHGKTLHGALRGFFLSQSYQCAVKED